MRVPRQMRGPHCTAASHSPKHPSHHNELKPPCFSLHVHMKVNPQPHRVRSLQSLQTPLAPSALGTWCLYGQVFLQD